MPIMFAIARPWLVRWMYAVAIGHFAVGVFLSWLSGSSTLDSYHHSVLHFFWPENIPVAARDLQIWWLSLFGATLQNLAIFMAVLTYVGNRPGNSFVWWWMIVGLFVWAPQDMFISLRANVLIHIWADILALLVMVPPLFLLWWNDRKKLL